VARDTWYHNQVPQVHNSEEVRVKKATIDTVEADDMSTWKIWKLKVRRPGQGMTRTLHVLHDDERERYEEELERRRTAAEDQPQVWEAFYELKEMFARLDYAYATTVHRAQGSTFDTVFVDYRDIAACRGPERRPLFYVAVTRPARRLAVLV
jgi:exodeoxyribonuclease-5